MATDFHSDMERLFCNNQKKDHEGKPLKEQFVTLFCTDNHYKFLKLNEKDPGDPEGRLIEETRKIVQFTLDKREGKTDYLLESQCKDIGGIWYSPEVPIEYRYRSDPPPREPEHGPICHESDTLAATNINHKIITWCKKVRLHISVKKNFSLMNSGPRSSHRNNSG